MGPEMFIWPKGVSAKSLVWFFAAVKMQIIQKILLNIFGVHITNFDSFYSFFDLKGPFFINTRNFVDKLIVPDFGTPLTPVLVDPLYCRDLNIKRNFEEFTNFTRGVGG